MKAKQNLWGLRNKFTGEMYPNFTYKTRQAARKASKSPRFGGKYTAVKIKVKKNVSYTLTPVKGKVVKTLTKTSKGALGAYSIAKSRPIFAR